MKPTKTFISHLINSIVFALLMSIACTLLAAPFFIQQLTGSVMFTVVCCIVMWSTVYAIIKTILDYSHKNKEDEQETD